MHEESGRRPCKQYINLIVVLLERPLLTITPGRMKRATKGSRGMLENSANHCIANSDTYTKKEISTKYIVGKVKATKL